MKEISDPSSENETGMGLQVARNSIFGAVQALISIAALFFITPYILKEIGVERYAVWALLGLITMYGMLSDFGITKALVYFIPKGRVEEGMDRINVLISTAMTFYLVSVTIVMAIMFALRNVIVVYLFKVPDYIYQESMFVVTGAILVFGLSIISGVYNSVLFGYQRVDVASYILIVYSILDPLGSFVALKLGYGLPGLMASRLVATIFMTLAVWNTAKKIAPGLGYHPRLFDREAFRSVFIYGINHQVSSISWMLDNSITKLLLPSVAGLSYVTYYHLAWRTRMRATSLFYGAMGSLTPAASELFASEDTQRLRSLYFRSIRYIFIFALPLFVLIAVLSVPFVNVWLGDGFELVGITIILLVLPGLFGLIRRSANEMLRGIGQVRPITYISMLSVAMHLVFTFSLGKIFGYFGVVAATMSASLISSYILIRICNDNLGVRFKDIPRHLSLGALSLALLLGILGFGIMKFAPGLSDLLTLLLVGTGYLVGYLAGIFGLRLLDKMDISLINKLTPRWLPIKRFLKA